MDFDMDEEALHRRRQQRLQEMKRQKQLQESRRKKLKKSLPVAAGAVAVLAVLLFSKSLFQALQRRTRDRQREHRKNMTQVSQVKRMGGSLFRIRALQRR